MKLASEGLGRPLRLLAVALLGAASLTACEGAAPVASHSPAPASTGASAASLSGTPALPQRGGVIPARVSVPAISVSAPVVAVGETPDGDLQSPTGWDDVGWFSLGFRPGAPGHAVLNGHLDTNLANRPTAVFWKLDKLQRGDAVIVDGADGSTLRFTVTALNYYPAEKAPLNQIFGPSNDSVVELVTCAGTWRGTKLGYSQRLVVTATLDQR
jgi:sortase (surface protein transpeptidase)